MQDLGIRWRGMSAVQKDEYRTPMDGEAEQRPGLHAEEERTVPTAWPHLGDDFYPLAAANLKDIPMSVNALNQV